MSQTLTIESSTVYSTAPCILYHVCSQGGAHTRHAAERFTKDVICIVSAVVFDGLHSCFPFQQIVSCLLVQLLDYLCKVFAHKHKFLLIQQDRLMKNKIVDCVVYCNQKEVYYLVRNHCQDVDRCYTLLDRPLSG